MDANGMNAMRNQRQGQSGRVSPALLRRPWFWVVLAVAVVALLEWMAWPFLRWPAERGLSALLKREVTIDGRFGIRFLGSLRTHMGRFVIGPPPPDSGFGEEQRDLLRATGLELAVPYATLFSLAGRKPSREDRDAAPPRRPYITALAADRVELVLARNAAGQANWRFRPARPDEDEPLVLPAFGRLNLGEGDIRIDDVPSRLKVQGNIRQTTEAPADTPGAAAVPGLQADATGTYRGQPVVGHARISALSALADAQAGDTALPIRLELRVGATQFAFTGQAKGIPHLAEADGTFRLSGASLAAVGRIFGVTLPTTASFSMHGQARKEGEVWSAAVEALAVGQSRLNGDFRYDPNGKVPRLTGRLGGTLLALKDLGPAVGASPNRSAGGRSPAPAAAADAGRRVLPQREFDIPSLAAMDADVSIALDALDLGSDQLEKMAPLRGHLILEERQLSILDLVAGTSNGTVRGKVAFDARRETPRWTAELNWSGIQLDRFIKTRNPADRAASSGYVSGILAGRARLTGDGRSTARILATLNGELQMWVRDGKISHLLVEALGLDIAQALGVLVRGDDPLAMRCAVASVGVRNGMAVPTVALIETSDSTVQGSGSISLSDERLDLVFKTAPKDISPAALRAPLHVEGNFADPEVRLDKRPIGMRVAAAAALAAITPVAALLALIDLGEEDKQACLNAVPPLRDNAPQTRGKPPRKADVRRK